MNRIQQTLENTEKILSIYYTAGYPSLNDTRVILKSLQDSGVEMVEIGLPFSDPLADGPVIQNSSTQALNNGMTTKLLLEQLQDCRKEIHIPILIMAYFNPILQYGVEAFCKKCNEIGIDGLIIPDLPFEEYTKKYKAIFEQYDLKNIFLITPQTSETRIREIDKNSNSFIYMVSSSSVTGQTSSGNNFNTDYFTRINDMKLQNKQIVGFGIHDNESFEFATKYTGGAIVGSAFIRLLNDKGIEGIESFVKEIKGK